MKFSSDLNIIYSAEGFINGTERIDIDIEVTYVNENIILLYGNPDGCY